MIRLCNDFWGDAMSKENLSEQDIRTKYITPAIIASDWDLHTQIREEVTFTAGRIIVRGKLHTRGKAKRADYVLYHKPNQPIAIVEAKDNNHSLGNGMPQALDYAEILDVPFAFSSNGDGFLFHDRTGLPGSVEQELTVVRLPNGVFNPYTSIKTNLLFFTKGEPTKGVWYYEHRYPEGAKSYNKTKPMRIEEFAPEKSWWNHREESEQSWKMSVEQIKDNGYNLDIKNPNTVADELGDPEELLADYKTMLTSVAETREALKRELMAALENRE